MKRSLMKITKWLGIGAAVLLLISALLLGIAQIMSPYVARYQPQLETQLSKALQRPVTVKSMAIRWRGIKPILALEGITLWDETKTQSQLNVKELGIGIGIFRSLVTWRWIPNSLTLSGTQLIIKQAEDGSISVNGIPWSPKADNSGETDKVIQELLTRGRIRVREVNVTWYDKSGLIVPLTKVQLKLSDSIITGHKFRGTAILGQFRQPAKINWVADFHGNILQPTTLQSKLSFHIQHLDLSEWLVDFSYAGLQIKNGTGDLQGSVSWSNKQLQKAQAEINFINLALQSQDKQTNTFQHLGAQLRWQETTSGWTLQGEQIQIEWNKNRWPENHFNLQWNSPTQNQPGNQVFQADFLNIADISQFLLATTLLPEQQQAQLKELQPTGVLQNVAIQHTGTQLLGTDLSGKLDLHQVGWKAWQKIPGIAHLTGFLQWNTQGGQLRLASQRLQLEMPTLFANVTPLEKLDGEINWQKKPEGWQITTSQLLAENKVFNLSSKLQLLWPTNRLYPVINLTTTFKIEDLHSALTYLPSAIMSPKLTKWLKQAIISGRADNGSLVLEGDLAQFPFDQGHGQFSVQASLHDATLYYHPEWPAIHHINGVLTVAGRALTIDANTAQILETHLTQVKAAFQDLTQPILQVTGQVRDDLRDGLAFLRQSPLQKTIGKNLQAINLQGPMNLNLAITLPLGDVVGKDKIIGNLVLHNDGLTLPGGLQLTQLQGALQFTEDGLSGNNIQGILLNQPLMMDFVSLPATKNQPKMTQVTLKSRANIKDIQQRFPSPWWRHVQGVIQYQAILQMPIAGNTVPNTLTIVSDLRDLAINLPSPLNKNVRQTTPSTATIRFAAAQPLKLMLNYANRLSVALTYELNKQDYSLLGGEVHLGAGNANFQTLPGLLITGQLTSLDIEAWQIVFDKMSTPATQKTAMSSITAKNWLRAVDVSFPQLQVGGQTLNQTRLKVQPVNEGWRVEVQSNNIDGNLLVPNNFPHGILTGNFSRLYLQTTTSKNSLQITPQQVPSLNITVNDLRYAGTRYGRLYLQTTVQDSQMQITELNLQSPNWTMNASGRWVATQKGGRQQTIFDGNLQSQNAGQMLSDLNITSNLASGKGNASFHLSWTEAPFQFALGNLNGKIALKVNQGRIINLKQSTQTEIGLGRVLNLLSLQTIPRRLRLDFSDLTDSGFAFDILQGDFLLDNGNMYTSNTYLDGPVAKVTLNGRIGLRAEDYDVALNVTPYVTSSLPIVATIAGGPIVGAATWVASKILSNEVGKFTTYRYRITGSWQQPDIVKLSEFKPAAPQQTG